MTPAAADRRTTVRHLAHTGMSQRAIAAQLGVSKDTVRRDLDALARDGAPEDAPPADAGARHDAPDAPDLAHPDAPPAPPAAHPARATDAPPPLPGAHPDAVRASAALHGLDPDAVRHLAHTRVYLRATLARATELLAHTGPLDAVERHQLRHLTERLHALADDSAKDTTC
ncbi:DeoR family transcriptional regulator [Streptomyces sp. Z26]|nr:DeoR family transcriptional regulator [Streptomyces sp. Z26]